MDRGHPQAGMLWLLCQSILGAHRRIETEDDAPFRAANRQFGVISETLLVGTEDEATVDAPEARRLAAYRARCLAAAVMWHAERLMDPTCDDEEAAAIDSAIDSAYASLPVSRAVDTTVKATVLFIDASLSVAREKSSPRASVRTFYSLMEMLAVNIGAPSAKEREPGAMLALTAIPPDLAQQALEATDSPGRRKKGSLGVNRAIVEIASALGVEVNVETVARYRRQAAAENPDAK